MTDSSDGDDVIDLRRRDDIALVCPGCGRTLTLAAQAEEIVPKSMTCRPCGREMELRR